MHRKIYCVGNAHLDPVWMWNWEEGSCEAKATIRSALDRMKEYPDFVFCCSAARVFEWIEEFDPEMFAEIRERVREGRFQIMGGWYVQPDCNNPSGESFARHSLYGQRYFQEKFGVTAKTGYNVDSFGHNGMLPQILKKSGMDQYVFMRPGPHEMELPSHVFRWKSPDGSEVLASRLQVAYNFDVSSPEEWDGTLDLLEGLSDPKQEELFFFYGVGNHGGGPTKRNIELIEDARKRHPDREIIFSDAKDFFDSVRTHLDTVPVVETDLQHHAAGCYSTHTPSKIAIRRAECELVQTEIFSMLGYRLGVKAAPNQEKLKEAWKNVLFCHFHDFMGGCSAEQIYEEGALLLGESRAVAAKNTNNVLQTVSWKIDTSDPAQGTPVILFNSHPFAVTVPLQLNKYAVAVYDGQGKRIPSQLVHSDVMLVRGTKDVLFTATVPAFGYATYFLRDNAPEGDETPADASDLFVGPPPADYGKFRFPNLASPDFQLAGVTWGHYNQYLHDTLLLENSRYRLEFEKHTGYLHSIYDKKNRREYLSGYGAVPVVLDETGYDTWAHGRTYWEREIGSFTDAKLEVLETGPVRARVRVTSFYGQSTLQQDFILPANGGAPTVQAQVDWHEQHKMLKLRFDTVVRDAKAYYEIPFGVQERPADGEEEPGLTWVAAKGKDPLDNQPLGFALLNDCKYSSCVKDGSIGLTVCRSPIFIDHGRIDCHTDEDVFMEQGLTKFRYSFLGLDNDTPWNDLITAARILNTPLKYVIENNHPGILPQTYAGLSARTPNVMVSAFKRSEDGQGLVLRAYETDGKPTRAILDGPMLPVPLAADFGSYSVNTYFLKDGAAEWTEVLMTEWEK